MSTPLFPLRYFLPETRLKVAARKHEVVEAGENGSTLVEAVDVTVTPVVRADPSARCRTSIDAGLLERLEINVSLDDDGLIRSIGTEVGRDPTPIISLAGRLLGTVTGFLMRARGGETLESQWRTHNERLHTLMAILSERLGMLLKQLGETEEPAQITEIGRALDIVHRELAAIDRSRREWISSQARDLEAVAIDVPLSAALRVEGNALPTTMPQATKPEGEIVALLKVGVLVAVADPYRPGGGVALTLEHQDTLLFRRSRPVTVGVYSRGHDEEDWVLRDDLVTAFDAVDAYSSVDPVSLDGSWLRSRKVDLSFHRDMSIEKYGIASTSSVSTVVTAAGSFLDAVDASVKAFGDVPSDAEKALAARKVEIDTLKTEDEFARLSRLRERSVELAELEQRAAITEAQQKIATGTS